MKQLAKHCSKKNAPLGITGLLLYSGGHFMQLLEGPESVVGGLFDLIHRDPRHAAVRRLLSKPVSGRLFPQWNMGLLNLDSTASSDLRGLTTALRGALPDRTRPAGTEGALALLREFRQQLPAPSVV